MTIHIIIYDHKHDHRYDITNLGISIIKGITTDMNLKINIDMTIGITIVTTRHDKVFGWEVKPTQEESSLTFCAYPKLARFILPKSKTARFVWLSHHVLPQLGSKLKCDTNFFHFHVLTSIRTHFCTTKKKPQMSLPFLYFGLVELYYNISIIYLFNMKQ